MTDEDADREKTEKTEIVRFPYSRVPPVRTRDSLADASYGKLAEEIGMPREQTTGHWCSRCNKIWFGYLLEVACPTCGNRHG